MKIKPIFILLLGLLLFQLANARLLPNKHEKGNPHKPNHKEKPAKESQLNFTPSNPPTCSTQYISLEDPFRGFNTIIPQDSGFVLRYAQDNITANNICEYYSSIYANTKSVQDPNHNIGFENGSLSNWIRIFGKNYSWVNSYKCGQLSMWQKAPENSNRFQILSTIPPKGDAYGENLFELRPPGYENNQFILKLGDDSYQQNGNILFRKIRIFKDNPILKYSYAVVLGNYPHGYCHAPYFRAILLNQNCEIIECASQTVNVIKNGHRLINTPNKSNSFLSLENPAIEYNPTSNNFVEPAFGKVAPWTSKVVNTSDYFVNSNHEYEDFTIAFITSACGGNKDMGYAYIDLEVGIDAIQTGESKNCNKSTLTFYGPTDNFEGETYLWNFGDGSPTSTEKNPKHKYETNTTQTYNVSLTITVTPPSGGNSNLPAPLCCSTFTYTSPILVEPCGGYTSTCNDCMNTFKPQEGKSYILSAWVKQDKANINATTNKLSFDQANIQLVFLSQTNTTIGSPINFVAKGEIIDGWQRIESTFQVPVGANSLDIKLKNIATTEGNYAYYDDIRIFPTDGSLKSYVYDPNSLKLVAELDENNYATLYEYNEGGVLVRVKKETERGIITIKESGENQSKGN